MALLANPETDLEGKFVVLRDSNETITGQKSFDRGTNAPFVVSNASAAMVANLDANKTGGFTAAQLRDASQLTGTLPNASVPNPLPGVSGENLVGLRPSNLIVCRCVAYHNTTQSAANNAWTTVALNAETLDSHAMHDPSTNNSRITIPAGGAGVYLVVAKIMFASSAVGDRAIAISKNAAGAYQAIETTVGTAPTISGQHILLTTVLSLADADFVLCEAFQNSGGALNIGDASRFYSNELSVVQLA